MRLKPPTLVLAFAALLALPLAAEEAKEKAAGKSAAPSTAAAMKVFVDPATGQVTSNPDPASRASLAAAPTAERPALKVEKVTTRAGGKKVRLDGRFTMEMTATTTPDGRATITCTDAPKPPASGSEEHRHDR